MKLLTVDKQFFQSLNVFANTRIRGCLLEGRKILLPGRSQKAGQLITLALGAELILVRVVPEERRFEKELKMAGDKNKNAICALLLCLLEFITSFQQNYHNNRLVVTPNENDRPLLP